MKGKLVVLNLLNELRVYNRLNQSRDDFVLQIQSLLFFDLPLPFVPYICIHGPVFRNSRAYLFHSNPAFLVGPRSI